MKILLLLIISTHLFGQTLLPNKDTTIYNRDGSIIQYQVEEHAIYVKTIKDQKSNGSFKAYYKNGKLWHSDNRIDNKIEGIAIDFTPNGDTAKIETWNNSKRINTVVFYSSNSFHPQKYYFVSKKGFTTLNNGKYISPSENMPDSLIQDFGGCEYMWLKGKPKLIHGDCKLELIKTGPKPGLYSINSYSKVFILPLDKNEK